MRSLGQNPTEQDLQSWVKLKSLILIIIIKLILKINIYR
jgi:hypothetical protein